MMRELLGVALDSYLSIQSNCLNETQLHLNDTSHRLNESVRRLTALTIAITAPTLIAGVYGMNFERMPELRWEYGYPFALALMVLAALGILAAFRWKEWL
jgi:magnesium transporter